MTKRTLTQNEQNFIINQYNYNTSGNIAKEIGCSRSLVLKIWRENHLNGKDSGRQYYCNFNYFENINTPNKAYILGFISSDGCIFRRDGHQGLWQIAIQEGDFKLLENISKEIKSNKPISLIKRNNPKYFNVCSLSINSDKMYNDLLNFGLVDNKSHTININNLNIPKNY